MQRYQSLEFNIQRDRVREARNGYCRPTAPTTPLKGIVIYEDPISFANAITLQHCITRGEVGTLDKADYGLWIVDEPTSWFGFYQSTPETGFCEEAPRFDPTKLQVALIARTSKFTPKSEKVKLDNSITSEEWTMYVYHPKGKMCSFTHHQEVIDVLKQFVLN